MLTISNHFFTLGPKSISSKWPIPVSKIWYVNLGPLISTWLIDLEKFKEEPCFKLSANFVINKYHPR